MTGYRVKQAWYFGPVEVSLDSIEVRPNDIRRPLVDEIKRDIEVRGLLHPIDLYWVLDGSNALHITRGNNRIQALLELGWSKVPCYIRVIDPGNMEHIGTTLKKMMNCVRHDHGDSARPYVGSAQDPLQWRTAGSPPAHAPGVVTGESRSTNA